MTERLAPSTAAPLGDVVTDRLELRRPRPDDIDALAEVFAKPEVWEYPFGRGLSRDESAGFLSPDPAPELLVWFPSPDPASRFNQRRSCSNNSSGSPSQADASTRQFAKQFAMSLRLTPN